MEPFERGTYYYNQYVPNKRLTREMLKTILTKALTIVAFDFSEATNHNLELTLRVWLDDDRENDGIFTNVVDMIDVDGSGEEIDRLLVDIVNEVIHIRYDIEDMGRVYNSQK